MLQYVMKSCRILKGSFGLGKSCGSVGSASSFVYVVLPHISSFFLNRSLTISCTLFMACLAKDIQLSPSILLIFIFEFQVYDFNGAGMYWMYCPAKTG